MASGEGRRDVPDSEDEPTTWSPAIVSDGGAADKLCATARVPHQDAQGAPKEATRHLLAPAESHANVSDRRIDGLGADGVNASVDVDSAKQQETNMQPSNSTSSQPLPRDAHDSSCVEHSEGVLRSKLVPDLTPAQQDFVPSNTASHDQPAADFEVTSTPDAELATPTDSTMHNAERTGHGHQVDATPEHAPPLSSMKCKPTPSFRIGEEQAASQGDVDEPVSPKDEQEKLPHFESSGTAVGMDSSPMSIAGESQSTMKGDASVPSCSITMVSSMSSPSADIPQCTGEPSANTAVCAAPSTSEPEPVSSIHFSVTGSGATLDSSLVTSPQAAATADMPVIAKTPQEVTLADLKAQKATMLASLAALPAIRVLMEETATSNNDMSGDEDEPTEADAMAAANKIVKDHIKLLHEYNELKDVGQGLMGLIADQRGVRIVEVQQEFGIEAND